MPRTLRPMSDANTLPYLRRGALSQVEPVISLRAASLERVRSTIDTPGLRLSPCPRPRLSSS